MKESRLKTSHPLFLLGFLVILYLGLSKVMIGSAQQESPTPTASSTPLNPPFISLPTNGQNVEGVVDIEGSTLVAGFTSSTIDFAYEQDQTNTWFEIQASNQSITSGVLARWDTHSITDGDYRLRLRIFTSIGEPRVYIVEDVHVRNYSATDTPLPLISITPAPTETSTPLASNSETTTPTSFPGPSPLPDNPMQVTGGQIISNLARGVIVIVVLFLFFGLLMRLRRQ